MTLYNDLEVRPCNILGIFNFEVCNGSVTLGAFMYEKDALLFKQVAEQKEKKMTGATLIQDERDRQRDVEKFTSVHDDGFKSVELARFAACYLLSYVYMNTPSGEIADLARDLISKFLPFAESEFKPKGEIGEVHDLVKAGALIAAEIDRLQRIKDGVSSI